MSESSMSTVKISVVICSIDAGKFARVCECYKGLLHGHPYEIIGIHDAKSLAEGYNRGLQRSTGGIVIFSHDDILIIERDLPGKLQRYLIRHDILGFAGASRVVSGSWTAAGFPYLHGIVAHALPKNPSIKMNIFGVQHWPIIPNIKLLDGLCIIATREAADAIRFDPELFDGFHLYDLDFSFRAHLAGYRLGVICDIPIIHESGGQFDQTYIHYATRFCSKYESHFDPQDFQPEVDIKPRHRPPSKGLSLPDHISVLKLWQRELLHRATISIARTNRHE